MTELQKYSDGMGQRNVMPRWWMCVCTFLACMNKKATVDREKGSNLSVHDISSLLYIP